MTGAFGGEREESNDVSVDSVRRAGGTVCGNEENHVVCGCLTILEFSCRRVDEKMLRSNLFSLDDCESEEEMRGNGLCRHIWTIHHDVTEASSKEHRMMLERSGREEFECVFVVLSRVFDRCEISVLRERSAPLTVAMLAQKVALTI